MSKEKEPQVRREKAAVVIQETAAGEREKKAGCYLASCIVTRGSGELVFGLADRRWMRPRTPDANNPK